MEPTKSYRIWFSQRCGSSLLCEAISATGLAAKPGEHFPSPKEIRKNFSNYEDFRQSLWDAGTANGIFAIKHSVHRYLDEQLFDEILRLRGIDKSADLNRDAIWQDIFPNCKHIFMTRRNKVRLAISWWRAIKDQVWHIKAGNKHQNDANFFETNYDFDALNQLLKESVLRECYMQEYFSTYGIKPLTIVYEDYIQDIPGTVKRVLDFLEIEYDELKIAQPYYNKLADDGSEQWVQRYRADLQKGNEPGPIW